MVKVLGYETTDQDGKVLRDVPEQSEHLSVTSDRLAAFCYTIFRMWV